MSSAPPRANLETPPRATATGDSSRRAPAPPPRLSFFKGQRAAATSRLRAVGKDRHQKRVAMVTAARRSGFGGRPCKATLPSPQGCYAHGLVRMVLCTQHTRQCLTQATQSSAHTLLCVTLHIGSYAHNHAQGGQSPAPGQKQTGGPVESRSRSSSAQSVHRQG